MSDWLWAVQCCLPIVFIYHWRNAEYKCTVVQLVYFFVNLKFI